LHLSFLACNGKLYPAVFLFISDSNLEQASMPMAARQPTFEMYQKGSVRPIFVTKMAGSRPLSEATEIDDTDFEEDFSDSEEYSGRRSEESVSRPLVSILRGLLSWWQVWQTKRYINIDF
jgi:hypothetical protein